MDKASVFHSARLTYREITVLDAKAIVRWRSDPGNYRNFFNAHAVDAEEHMAWYEQYVRDSSRFDFVIVDPEGASIGTVTLSSICERSCELSYMIGEVSARGNGYAVEAVGAMTSIAFEELGVDEVFARILPSNVVSMHVAERAGYEEAERVYRRTRHVPDIAL